MEAKNHRNPYEKQSVYDPVSIDVIRRSLAWNAENIFFISE